MKASDSMTKTELASDILEILLGNGMISLEYGQAFYQEGKQECIQEIKRILDDYVIVEGRVIN